MVNEITSLEKKINSIRNKIMKVKCFRAGSLSEQYSVCGKSGCKCQAKENQKKHGPYYQVGYYLNKKHTTLFVRKKSVKLIKSEVENYKKLKELFDEWIKLED